MGLGVGPPSHLMVLRAWGGSRIPALEPFFQFPSNLVKGSGRPSSGLSTLPVRLYLQDTALLSRRIRFRANFVASVSTNQVSLHEENNPGPPGPFRPCKVQGYPGLSLSLPLSPPSLGTTVSPSLLSGHAFSTPILFFRSRSSCGEKGAKAKRKHPGRISRGGFPEHGRGRSRSGVGRQGCARGLRGNRVAGGPRRTPGSCPERHRSSSPGKGVRV